MDWKTLFLTANGRIGQKDFWIGWVILFAAGFILGMIPFLGMIIGIALIYPNVCVFSKRLHDFGKSGWLAAVPYAIACVGLILMMVVGGAGMMASLGGAMLILLLMFVAGVAFLLWVGLTKGDPGENQYGPPPRSLIGDDATTPVV